MKSRYFLLLTFLIFVFLWLALITNTSNGGELRDLSRGFQTVAKINQGVIPAQPTSAFEAVEAFGDQMPLGRNCRHSR